MSFSVFAIKSFGDFMKHNLHLTLLMTAALVGGTASANNVPDIYKAMDKSYTMMCDNDTYPDTLTLKSKGNPAQMKLEFTEMVDQVHGHEKTYRTYYFEVKNQSKVLSSGQSDDLFPITTTEYVTTKFSADKIEYSQTTGQKLIYGMTVQFDDASMNSGTFTKSFDWVTTRVTMTCPFTAQ
jgi:hypothetical protein